MNAPTTRALRQTALLLQVILRLVWSPLLGRRAVEFAILVLLLTSTATASFLLFAPTVYKFCNIAGATGMVLVTAAVGHGFFLMVLLGGGDIYFANFCRLIRWPVSCRQIAWCSIISVSVDPRILLFLGPLLAVVAALLNTSPAAFLVGGAALVLTMTTGCAAMLTVAGALQQLRGPYASTANGSILAAGVAFGIFLLHQTFEVQSRSLGNGSRPDFFRLVTCLPLTCLPARAVRAYMTGSPGVACALFAGAGMVVFLLVEMAAWLGARSATQR